MFNAWFFLTVVLAIVDWIAIYRDHTAVNYFAKPAALLALIAWFTSLGGWQLGLTLFGLALIFSLAGDILLMLPDRFFIYGLYAFLIAHICYIIGFDPAQPVDTLPTLLIGTGVLLISSILFNGLRKAILVRQDQRKMETPLLIYSLALSMMLFSALLTLAQPTWTPRASGLAAAGGILFFGSDGLLAYNRFVKTLPNAQFYVRIGYHLGQIALIAGVLLNFLTH